MKKNLEYMFLLAGKIMPGVEKLQGKLLFPEEKQFSECRKWSQQVRNF